jgi:hypothetical protein
MAAMPPNATGFQRKRDPPSERHIPDQCGRTAGSLRGEEPFHDMFEAGASVGPVVLHVTGRGANATIDAGTLRKFSERRALPRSGRTDS